MKDDERKSKVKMLLKELVACRDEARQSEIVLQLDRISPDPKHIDYIYQTDEYIGESGQVDFDSIVEKIFSYRPIRL